MSTVILLRGGRQIIVKSDMAKVLDVWERAKRSGRKMAFRRVDGSTEHFAPKDVQGVATKADA